MKTLSEQINERGERLLKRVTECPACGETIPQRPTTEHVYHCFDLRDQLIDQIDREPGCGR